MQTLRGDAAESLIVEQLFAGFNPSCGWHCLNYWLQMTHASTFQLLIGHMSCQNISTPAANEKAKQILFNTNLTSYMLEDDS